MSRNRDEIATKFAGTLLLGAFVFECANGELREGTGASVTLRNQSIQVLQFLAQHNAAAVGKEDLIAAVWGDTHVTDDSLVQCISEIRRALKDTNQTIIQTLPRKGYRLNGTWVPDAPVLPKYAHHRGVFIRAFKSIVSNNEHVAFAEGLSEDLITRLSMLRNLDVTAEHSGYSFKNRNAPSRDGNPDSETVLMGSVRISGNKVRVTAQLLKQATDEIIFSRRYDRELEDIFEIQDDIAGNIIAETQIALTEGEAARMAHRRTRSVKAWERFHQAVLEHFKYTASGNTAARHLYREALRHDPAYLDARVGEAWTYWFDGRSSHVFDPDQSLRKCRNLADSLVTVAPDMPDVIQLDAALLVLEGDFDRATKRADEAFRAGPSFLYTRAITAWVHLYAGNFERAREIYREHISASEYVADDTLFYFAQCLSLLGEHDEAVSLAQDYRRRVPGTVYGYTLLATALGLAGRKEAARATITQLHAAHPSFSLETFCRHEPFKDQSITEMLESELREAGLT